MTAQLPAELNSSPQVRVLAFDEARFGLINWHKRRYCPQAVKPPWVVQRKYEWTWLYAAVEPSSGEDCCLYLPRLDGSCYQAFLHYLSGCYPNDLLLLIQDNAPAHLNSEVVVPENVIPLPLPPYSPELNPVERWFLEFRRKLANRLFETVAALQEAMTQVLQHYWQDRAALKSLTNFPWWQQAIEQLCR